MKQIFFCFYLMSIIVLSSFAEPVQIFRTVLTGNIISQPLFLSDNTILLLTHDGVLWHIDKKGVIVSRQRMKGTIQGDFFWHVNGGLYISIGNSLQVYTTALKKLHTFYFPYAGKGSLIPLQSGNIFQYTAQHYRIFSHTGVLLQTGKWDKSILPHFTRYTQQVLFMVTMNTIFIINEYGRVLHQINIKERVVKVTALHVGIYVEYASGTAEIINRNGKQTATSLYSTEQEKIIYNKTKIMLPDMSSIIRYPKHITYYNAQGIFQWQMRSIFNSEWNYVGKAPNNCMLIVNDKFWIVYGIELQRSQLCVNKNTGGKYVYYGLRTSEGLSPWMWHTNKFFNQVEKLIKRHTFSSLQNAYNILESMVTTMHTQQENNIETMSMISYLLFRIITDFKLYSKAQYTYDEGNIFIRIQAVRLLQQLSVPSMLLMRIAQFMSEEPSIEMKIEYISLLQQYQLDPSGMVLHYIENMVQYSYIIANKNLKKVLFLTLDSLLPYTNTMYQQKITALQKQVL